MREQGFNFFVQLVNRRIHFARQRLDQMQLRRSPCDKPQVRQRPRCAGRPPQSRFRRRCGTNRSRPSRACACRRKVPSNSRPASLRSPPIWTTRTMSPYLSPKNCITSLRFFTSACGNFRPRDAGVFEDAFVDELLDVGDLRGVSGALLKSNVNLSGPTNEPFCEASLLATSCNAQCKQMRDGVMPLDRIAARFRQRKA